MTAAEVLAAELGMTPETHRWAYANYHGERDLYGYHLTLPNPLAPGTEADVWLGLLVRSPKFVKLYRLSRDFIAHCSIGDYMHEFRSAPDPVLAIVLAMMAVDPAFRARMEGASE